MAEPRDDFTSSTSSTPAGDTAGNTFVTDGATALRAYSYKLNV